MFDFTDRVVIITGGAGNLGEAVTRAFLRAGAHVAPVDHREGRLRQLFADIAGSDAHLLAEGVDLTDPGAVAGMVQAVQDRFGRLDVLVNAVGGFRMAGPLHETPLDVLDHMFNLNVRTVFIACQKTIPSMLAQGSGKIINVAARNALSGTKNLSAYNAAKSAVLRLTESMSQELRAKGVNVNCVLPGTIDTPENREAMPNADHAKWVAPESLADAILFLASEAARDVHGAALPVTGLS